MRSFVFLIGSTDEFDSIEELVQGYHDCTLGEKNASIFQFKLRADCGTDRFTVRDIATLIGKGNAFESSWSEDGTVSTLLEVE